MVFQSRHPNRRQSAYKWESYNQDKSNHNSQSHRWEISKGANQNSHQQQISAGNANDQELGFVLASDWLRGWHTFSKQIKLGKTKAVSYQIVTFLLDLSPVSKKCLKISEIKLTRCSLQLCSKIALKASFRNLSSLEPKRAENLRKN